jgi:hypothetical protein
MSTVIDEAFRVASSLITHGYEPSEYLLDEQRSGSGFVLLVRGDVRLRIVSDRCEWFVELGSAAAPDEWFDARLVLREIGAEPPDGVDGAALESLCKLLTAMAPQWELLFSRSTFAVARPSLRKRQIALAKELFGGDFQRVE